MDFATAELFVFSDPDSIARLIDHERRTGYGSAADFEAHACDAEKAAQSWEPDVKVFRPGHPFHERAKAKISAIRLSAEMLRHAAQHEARIEAVERADVEATDIARGIAFARRYSGTLFPMD